MCRPAIARPAANRGVPPMRATTPIALTQTDMLVLLLQLQNLLERCRDGSVDGAALQQLCLDLQGEVPRAFKAYADPTLAAADFARYHRGLVDLHACVLGQCEPPVAAAVGRLLRNHETLFADLIAPSEPLPDFHTAALAEAVSHEWDHIRPRLLKKGVPDAYLAEIGHAWDALFTKGKMPVPAYHHRQYLPEFLGMLRQLADDPRDKDWPKRFVEALVSYNFNYMGFFNRWKDQLSMELRKAWPHTHAEDVLARYQETVSLYHSLPTAFDLNWPPLKVLMERWIGQLRESNPETAKMDTALRTDLLAGDMAVRFRYRFKTGEFDYRTQRHAARDFVKVHLNQTGQEVAAHTLTKFDKEALYAPALRYRRQLKEELRLLEKEFDLGKPPERR